MELLNLLLSLSFIFKFKQVSSINFSSFSSKIIIEGFLFNNSFESLLLYIPSSIEECNILSLC
jgi:hypothetical protein